MSKQMSSGVMIALRPVICQDVGLRIQKIIKDEYHKEFRQELLERVYKHLINQCDKHSYSDIVVYWSWYEYRERCFPNEIGCNCCDGGYPEFNCKKEWSKNQKCICKIDKKIGHYCECDAPYRRQHETHMNCCDIESQDYEFFQKMK
jgi:hypothetical protein